MAAFVSCLTGRPVRGDLAMTGEITLPGHVLAVGAIYEKVQGAVRRGLAHVVLPELNQKHFEQDVPEDLRRQVTAYYVRRVDDVLGLVLLPAEAAASRRRDSDEHGAGRPGELRG